MNRVMTRNKVFCRVGEKEMSGCRLGVYSGRTNQTA